VSNVYSVKLPDGTHHQLENLSLLVVLVQEHSTVHQVTQRPPLRSSCAWFRCKHKRVGAQLVLFLPGEVRRAFIAEQVCHVLELNSLLLQTCKTCMSSILISVFGQMFRDYGICAMGCYHLRSFPISLLTLQ